MSDLQWQQVAPELDELVGRLRPADRLPLLLRFYQRQSLAEVGVALGISEDAARMRVDRAVEKLRTKLRRQGVTLAAGGLAGLWWANSGQAVPAGVAAAVMGAVSGATAPSASAVGIAEGVRHRFPRHLQMRARWAAGAHRSSELQHARLGHESRQIVAVRIFNRGRWRCANWSGCLADG